MVIGLGANLGDARRTVLRAFDEIEELPGVQVLSRSRLYRTTPVGGPPQADYVNAAVAIRTTLAPRELLARLQEIELRHGRQRSGVRDEPRTLDLDVLWIDGERVDEPELVVPHPRLWDRAFALVPLVEVAPLAREPGSERGYAERLVVIGESGVQPLD